MMKDSLPLVSVIITCYNYAEFVGEAIDSVLQQTYKNIEFIIIDDGSTDNSLEVIRKYASQARIVTRENKGIVYTRNEGLRLAKGAYMCFLDADDYFDKDYIEKSMKVAIKYDADVVYPNWHIVGDKEYHTYYPDFDLQLLIRQEIHCTSESLIRLKATRGHKFESELVAEDWDFFLGMALAGKKFKLAKDNFINYRVRENTRGSSRPYWDDMYHYCQILQKWHRKYPAQVNPFDLPIARGKSRDSYIEHQTKMLKEKDEIIRDRDRSLELLHEKMVLLQNSYAYRIGSVVIKPMSVVKRRLKN